MRKEALFLLVLMPCISFASAADECTTANILNEIRPGSPWVMQNDSIKSLNWMDKKQKKPTSSEVEAARRTCIEKANIRDAQKIQAKLDVKNPAIPIERKVEALILLLDMDK